MSLNLARIDLVSLRLAVLCAELGSLSAAAERAHCSVSTASHRLSCLEQSFGTPLFTRGPRGLSTTGRGDLLVRHGRAILQHVEFMHEVVRGSASSAFAGSAAEGGWARAS